MKRILLAPLFLLLTMTVSAQVQTTTVTGTVRDATGTPVPGAKLRITKLIKGGVVVSTQTVPVTADSSGVVSFTVLRNSQAVIEGPIVGYTSGCTVNIPDASTAAFENFVCISPVPPSNLTAHLTAADPHPIYLTQPEGDARYAALGSGVTDHGALTGLSDDDHPQYHNDARGDLRYYTKAQLYTKTEADVLLAAKANASHTHTLSEVTDAGTAAALNVPASGNAASGEVVKGSDTRLTDARTPAGTAGGDLTGTYPNPTLVGVVTAGSCTNCNVTFDAKGRVTAAGNGAGGVTSFNTRTGAVTQTSGDVTGALGYTPLSPANNLSDVASAATARSNIGAGTSSLTNGAGSNVIPKSNGTNLVASNLSDDGTKVSSATFIATPAFETLTDAATITWTFSGAQYRRATVTLGGNRTLAISGATNGAEGTFVVCQDATGSRAVTLPAGSKVVNGGAGAVTLTTSASACDVLSFTFNGTSYFWTLGRNFN